MQHWIVPYIMAVLLVLAVASPVAYYLEGSHSDSSIRRAQAAADHAIHRAQLDACRRSNAVREAGHDATVTLVRINIAILARQIDQSRALPHSFFPSIPPAKYRALVRRQDHRDRRQIRALRSTARTANTALRPVHCARAVPDVAN